ncbi:MAG: hypothetical protein GY953_21920, partial [bacterium]|nr:hypothetical protein [bacterium]
LEADAWRWTGPNPTLRYVLKEVEGLSFVAEYSVPSVTLDRTGPVTMSFSINGRFFERRRHAEAGQFTLDKPVERSWLKPEEDNIVAIEIDPVWVAPNGTQLGFILTRAGFIEQFQ